MSIFIKSSITTPDLCSARLEERKGYFELDGIHTSEMLVDHGDIISLKLELSLPLPMPDFLAFNSILLFEVLCFCWGGNFAETWQPWIVAPL